MLTYPPTKYRKGHIPVQEVVTKPFELISAEYFGDDLPYVVLGFDRAIDISGIIVGSFSLSDGYINACLYQGTGSAVLTGTMIVTIQLAVIGSVPEGGEFLTVPAGNGIVTASGGVAWPGVTDVALPYSI